MRAVQSCRPFGTAAQLTVVVPAEQAIVVPDGVPNEVGACLGHPGDHRAPGGEVGGCSTFAQLGLGRGGRGPDRARPSMYCHGAHLRRPPT
jgi:NADPH:quinone reductase